jgi:competence protein ComEA
VPTWDRGWLRWSSLLASSARKEAAFHRPSSSTGRWFSASTTRIAPSVADVLTRFAFRSSAPDPSQRDAARARLERVVTAPASGWLPAEPDADHPPEAGVDDAAPPAASRSVGGHARPRAPRRRFDGRTLAALGVIAVVSLLLATWYVWRSWPVAADVPDRSEIVTPAPAVPTGAPVSTSPSPAPAAIPAAGSLVVHVAGTVVDPGIVTLPAGARVADAIQAAGGALPETDLSGVNLARILVDGEQVLVGLPAVAGAPLAATPAPSGGSETGPLDLNSATLDQLQNLPGVGPVLAQRIVDWRTDNGRFTSVEELQEIDGIGEQRLEDLRSRVRV